MRMYCADTDMNGWLPMSTQTEYRNYDGLHSITDVHQAITNSGTMMYYLVNLDCKTNQITQDYSSQ